MSTLFAFLHHLAAFTLFSFLTVEFILLKGELTVARAKQILIADGIYGASAGLILVIGLLRVFYFEKGSDYYFHSIPFIIKLSTFVIVGLISIYPTLEFMSWRSTVKQGQAPKISEAKVKTIRKIMHWELVGLTIILLCAALMAKGVGYVG
jgi:putative membrane protein